MYFQNLSAPIGDFSALIRLLLLLLTAFTFAGAQNPPKEIRGYKVYNAKITVRNQFDKTELKDKSEASVKIGEPEIVDVSLTGITLELPAEFESAGQGGSIDFISFKDFRVNNLAVDVEEYKQSFTFTKNKTTAMPKPFKIRLGAGEALRGAMSEAKNSKTEWTVTGTVFIFGRFKKFGFSFKRVVPVEINLKIKNPLNKSEQ